MLSKENTAQKRLIKPIISSEMNSFCQINFTDMQMKPNGIYICVYQHHFTTFIILKLLKYKNSKANVHFLMNRFIYFFK